MIQIGLGMAVLGIWVAVMILTQLTTDAIFGQGYYTATGWPKAIGMWLTGVFVWFGVRMVKRMHSRQLQERNKGETKPNQPNSSGGFILPVEYSSVIFVIIGIVILLW